MIGGNGDYPVTSELPGCVRDWAEVEGCNPQVHDSKKKIITINSTLAELNDEGKTFNEIADLIEKQL
jgi:hypothetical protein